MMEYIDISILNPAEYNPRLLTNEAQEDLKKSIKELGIIKPIIIRQSDKRIMAGSCLGIPMFQPLFLMV